MCQLATPAQIACAKCPGCTRVAGELRSRRAAEINLTINYALNVDMSSSRKKLLFSFNCRVLVTRYAVRLAERANEAHAAHRLCMAAEMTREAHLQCTTACCLGGVLCVSVALERG